MRKFELPAELVSAVASLASELDTFLQDARDSYEERSERWRDSDEAVEVDGWMDDIGAVVDALEALPTVPG